MHTKRILVADADPGTLEQFSQALGNQWEIIPAFSGAAALTLLNGQPCEVVVANLDLPEVDGAELLNRIRRKYPKTIRFLAAKDGDKQRVLKARGAHQFLAKPYDTGAIKDAIERALALDVWVGSDRVRESIARIRTLPTIPTLYMEVVAALRSGEATTEQVGGIIAKDMAMMTKMLQVLNSACFGLTREITDPAEAVGILGFETVKTMVMTIKLLNEYDKLKASEFSIDRLWTHSTNVARTARELTLLETGDRTLADASFTAGLLHDLGKVVMVANFEDSYSGALLIGFKQQLTAWDVERDVFGSNHGEIGAYLLGLWGMPLNILEAAALHHEPSRSPNKAFSPLTAVHVANVLERESSPDELGMISPKLDEVYLDGLGLLKRVKVWREAIANRDGVKLQSEIPGEKAVEADPVASAKPASAAAPSTPASASAPSQQTQFIPARRLRVREPEVVVAKSKVIFAAVGACVVAFLTWLVIATFNNELDSTQITLAAPIKEKPARVKAAVLAVAAPKTDQSAASAKPSDHTAPKPASAANLALSLLPATEVRARETTNASTVPAPKPAPAPEFKLQGIFFSSGDPSAILNGKTVRPNERINGALVVSITASNVTLQIQDQRKVLAIK